MHRVHVFMVLSLCVQVMSGAELNWDFSDSKLNAAPEGFRSTLSGAGQPGDWRILMDDLPSPFVKSTVSSKRAVLAQVSRDATDERFPLLVYEGEKFYDFKLTTQFKLVEGQQEQMAGIAFRIQDERNYYYVRASGLGKSFYFLKRVNDQLYPPIGSKMEFATGLWHELVLECRGNEIRCQVDGKDAFPMLQDNSFGSGRIGFWTKSDSVCYFAQTKIHYTPRELPAQKFVRQTLEKYDRLQGLKIYAVRTTNSAPQVVASKDPAEIGKAAGKTEQDVLARGTMYYLKEKGVVEVTMPVRDCNGEIVAAARVVMKYLPGQTEKTSIERATPVVKWFESKFQVLSDLVE